jgi:multicomponent Na+:H+ antiporter subunit F
MNYWLLAALAMLPAIATAGVVCFRGGTANRIVGLELSSALIVLELVLISEGFHRSIDMDLAVTLAFLSFGGGFVFVRFLQRWL